MKFGLLILSLIAFQQFSVAQDDPANITLKDLVGRWDVIYSDESVNGLLDEFIEETKNADVETRGNHNIAVLTFQDNGAFDLMSIQDFSASDQEGTFEVSEDGQKINCQTKMPRGFKKRDREKMKKRNMEVLYFEKDVLVIKSKRAIMYMKRTS